MKENLISANPFIDAGYVIHIQGNQGTVHNPITNECFQIYRDNNKWLINLQDMSCDAKYAIDVLNANVQPYDENTLQKVIALHEKMSHASTESMIIALNNNVWLNSDISAREVQLVMKHYVCPHCVLGKTNKPPIAAPSGDRTDVLPGEIISADIVGKINPPTYDNQHCYYILFVDVATGYMHAFTAKVKDSFDDALCQVIEWYKSNGLTPKILRTDSEMVLQSQSVTSILQEHGMTAEYSAPYAHYQNIVERYVQTCNKGISTMLHAQEYLPANTWHLALFHFIKCRNHTPNKKSKLSTPHQIITGSTVNLSKQFQFTFGDTVAVRIPPETKSWKFDLKYDLGIYVGQPDGSVDSGLIFLPYDRKLIVRTDLIRITLTNEQFLHYSHRRHGIRDSTTPWKAISTAFPDIEYDFSVPADVEHTNTTLQLPLTTNDAPIVPPRTKKVIEKSDRVLRSMTAHHVTSHSVASICAFQLAAPKMNKLTVTSALRSPQSSEWKQAIQSEISSLIEKTQTLVPETIDRSKPYLLIHTTMQLKVKMLDANTIDKYKARCCGCGNELQDVALDRYSPTISNLAHSIVHQIAIIDGMHTCTIDTVGAYLNQDYPMDATPLYVTLPRNVAEVCGLDPEQTYRIHKYIYGLPDSGKAYYLAYRNHLLEHGYNPTFSDPCLFTKFEDNHRIYIWFHVDDTYVASSDKKYIMEFQNILQKKFEITINENVDAYLGVNMKKLADGSIQLTQPKLLKTIFEEYKDVIDGDNSRTHYPSKPQATVLDDEQNVPISQNDYLHLLGMLNYMTKSRPDIATAVSFAASHSKSPTQAALNELLNCVTYLYHTQEKGLILRPHSVGGNELQLKCYVDASYLTHGDSKSHSGYCLSFGDIGTFYSKSKKQATVTTSSTHAEIRALYELIVEIIFTVNLCNEIQRPLKLPAIIMEDNQPTIDLSKELSHRVKKCKHFLMLVNFIREQVEGGLIQLQKVDTDENIADILTKIIVGPDFTRKANKLLGVIATS